MHTALESVLEHLLLFFIFPQFLGHMFVVVNMVLQVAGCLMILIRKYVTVAVGMLFGIILLQVCRVCVFGDWYVCCFSWQSVTYTVLWDVRFFMR